MATRVREQRGRREPTAQGEGGVRWPSSGATGRIQNKETAGLAQGLLQGTGVEVRRPSSSS